MGLEETGFWRENLIPDNGGLKFRDKNMHTISKKDNLNLKINRIFA